MTQHTSKATRLGMSGLRAYDLMSRTSLVSSVGVATAAFVVTVSGPAAWPVWLALAAGSSAITAGTIGLLYARARQDCLAVEQHLRALSRVNPRDVAANTTAGDASPLPERHPLSGAVAEVREAAPFCISDDL